MKPYTHPLFRNLIIQLLLLLTVGMGACKDDDDDASAEVKFNNISITGAEEAPNPVTTTATGTLNATYNQDTKILTYTITFTGVTPTNMHFHKGAVGVAGPVEIGIPAPYNSPINGTTIALTAEQEADLLAGNWYVNIHSAAYPGGEIRGQLIAR